MIIKSLNQAVELSLNAGASKSYEADFKIPVNKELWRCHEVSISYRDIFLYCNEGDCTFLVDSYGGNNVAVIHDWSNSNE